MKRLAILMLFWAASSAAGDYGPFAKGGPVLDATKAGEFRDTFLLLIHHAGYEVAADRTLKALLGIPRVPKDPSERWEIPAPLYASVLSVTQDSFVRDAYLRIAVESSRKLRPLRSENNHYYNVFVASATDHVAGATARLRMLKRIEAMREFENEGGR